MKINILSPEILKNPYPTYNLIREQQPICEIHPGGIWLISRFKDVKEGLLNHDLYTATRKVELFSPNWLNPKCQSDLFLTPFEPPEYHIRRAAINTPFNKYNTSKLKSLMEKTAKTQVQKLLSFKKIEVLNDFVYPYIGIIMSAITGLENLQTTEETFQWIKAVELITTQNLSLKTIEYIESIILKQKSIFEKSINSIINLNTESFISNLTNKPINNKQLTTNELINATELIIRSGFQTTTHLLANAILQLSRNKFALKKLIKSPSLIPNFVDELLRLYSSIPLVVRHTTAEVTLHGVTIPKGGQVYFSLAAANRDPRVFINPDDIDLAKRSETKHIAFGYGPHSCMGLHLARLEIQVALSHLLPIMDTISCPDDKDIQWIDTLLFRGFQDLPITINKVSLPSQQ